MPNDFVGRRSTIGHKEQMVCVKDTSSIALTSSDRAGVIQQLTQFIDRITNVGAKHVLAKKLMEHLPYWAFQESHAT